MKQIVIPAASVLASMLLGACDTPPEPTHSQATHLPPATQVVVDPNAHGQVAHQVTTTTTTPPPPPSEPSKPKTDPKPSHPIAEQPVVQGNLPYAKPVPGKPGFVFSPYEQYKGYIDVHGYPPGSEVKDPYSGKSFLVP